MGYECDCMVWTVASGLRVTSNYSWLPLLIQDLSSKRGGRGGRKSLVTSAREAVNFWCVIYHVIIVGHSYFSNICHVI